MESSNPGRDCTAAGDKRAGRIRTRAQTKKLEKLDAEREAAKEGLSQTEYWAKNVRSKADIVRFYELYYPNYPDCLAKAIAERVSSIVEKSRAGEKLTEEEAGYYRRSIAPNPTWDPLEELKE